MTVWAIVNHSASITARRFPHQLAGPLGDWTAPPFAAPSTPGVHFGLYFTFWTGSAALRSRLRAAAPGAPKRSGRHT